MTANISKPLYWSILSYEGWNLHIAATEKGLCFVGSQNQSFDELTIWARKRYPEHSLIRDDDKLLNYQKELILYLQGELEQFTLPLDYKGTPFQEAVWNALCEIPYGQTRSYSDIAHHIHKPNSVRAVGTAIGANPILITVPCHRVIGKNGKLTGYRGGIDMKTSLLTLEQQKNH